MSKKNLFLIICAIILFIILSIAIKADYLYGFESISLQNFLISLSLPSKPLS